MLITWIDSEACAKGVFVSMLMHAIDKQSESFFPTRVVVVLINGIVKLNTLYFENIISDQ